MRLLSRRKSEERTLTTVPGWVQPSTNSYIGPPALTQSAALQVGDVWACARVLADAAASVPLISYRRAGEGRTRLQSGLPARLLDKPAPATTQANLINLLVAHLVLYGNAFLGKFRGEEGRIEQIGLLHPERVTVELRAGMPLYTVTGPRGEQSLHGVDDIVHIRGMSTEGLLGLSPIKQCRVALELASGLGVHAAAFFENGGRPSGILKVGAEIDEDSSRSLLTELNAHHVGARNAHRIAVISGPDVEWTALSGPLDDLQFVEQRKLSTAEICRIFRVPPWMVGAGAGDSLTYSNVEHQQLAFVTHSLRPWLVQIEQAISADADLCPGPNVYVEFLLDALLRADSATRAAVYTQALNPDTGWMTRDEVRRLENLSPEGTSA